MQAYKLNSRDIYCKSLPNDGVGFSDENAFNFSPIANESLPIQLQGSETISLEQI